jgi:hypothetical protein
MDRFGWLGLAACAGDLHPVRRLRVRRGSRPRFRAAPRPDRPRPAIPAAPSHTVRLKRAIHRRPDAGHREAVGPPGRPVGADAPTPQRSTEAGGWDPAGIVAVLVLALGASGGSLHLRRRRLTPISDTTRRHGELSILRSSTPLVLPTRPSTRRPLSLTQDGEKGTSRPRSSTGPWWSRSASAQATDPFGWPAAATSGRQATRSAAAARPAESPSSTAYPLRRVRGARPARPRADRRPPRRPQAAPSPAPRRAASADLIDLAGEPAERLPTAFDRRRPALRPGAAPRRLLRRDD